MEATETKLRRIEDRLEGIEETMEILADKRLLISIKKSLDDIKSGKYRDYAGAKEFRGGFQRRAGTTPSESRMLLSDSFESCNHATA
jgi:soluble cytochrome b562